jgi:hypothetical protein
MRQGILLPVSGCCDRCPNRSISGHAAAHSRTAQELYGWGIPCPTALLGSSVCGASMAGSAPSAIMQQLRRGGHAAAAPGWIKSITPDSEALCPVCPRCSYFLTCWHVVKQLSCCDRIKAQPKPWHEPFCTPTCPVPPSCNPLVADSA